MTCDLFLDRSAEGPVSAVEEGGVESRLRSAGVRRQHRHSASLRPDGQRALRHPASKRLLLLLLLLPSLCFSLPCFRTLGFPMFDSPGIVLGYHPGRQSRTHHAPVYSFSKCRFAPTRKRRASASLSRKRTAARAGEPAEVARFPHRG